MLGSPHVSLGRDVDEGAQDLLGLGSEARLNTPGTTHGNWQWRVPEHALTEELARHCARLNASFGRA